MLHTCTLVSYGDKQIIAGIINFSNSVKVEMYSHSRSVFHQAYLWLMSFYPFLHRHTDSPEEKPNLVIIILMIIIITIVNNVLYILHEVHQGDTNLRRKVRHRIGV